MLRDDENDQQVTYLLEEASAFVHALGANSGTPQTSALHRASPSFVRRRLLSGHPRRICPSESQKLYCFDTAPIAIHMLTNGQDADGAKCPFKRPTLNRPHGMGKAAI